MANTVSIFNRINVKILATIFFFSITKFAFGQGEKILKCLNNEQNVVASVIDGHWKEKKVKYDYQFKFSNDTTVLKIISKKYYKMLSNYKIYHAGYMEFKNGDQVKIHPYFLTEMNGNPHLMYFRERDGNPIGDAESFNLFIAKGESRKDDRLFVGGDFNNQPFFEFERTK